MLVPTAVADVADDRNFNVLPMALGDGTSSDSDEGLPMYHTQRQRGWGRIVGLLIAAACVMVGAMLLYPGSQVLHGDIAARQALVLIPVECTVAMDRAYFYTEPLDGYIENVTTADGCCQKCRAASHRCRSWTWVKNFSRCFTISGLPAFNVSRKGHVSGISSMSPDITLPPTHTVPPTEPPAPMPAPWGGHAGDAGHW